MAFTKKEWKDRVSAYPSRRKLVDDSTSEEMIVNVSRYEGEIIEDGDAFSAENMNDLEDRINNAITATAGEIVTFTLSSSNWSNKQYSFEATYPSSSYDIEVQPNGDVITTAQLNAWNSAKMVGSANSNVLKAMDVVPTINIPVIIKVVTK